VQMSLSVALILPIPHVNEMTSQDSGTDPFGEWPFFSEMRQATMQTVARLMRFFESACMRAPDA
jgi:hypothetical protein